MKIGKSMAKGDLAKRILDLFILLIVINEVAIYMYFRNANNGRSNNPTSVVVRSEKGNDPELECALGYVKAQLQVTPNRTFIQPGGVPMTLCIVLGGKGSDVFKRVQLFMRVLGMDLDAFDAVNGSKDLVDAKYGRNTRTNFNLPDYMNRTCGSIPKEKLEEYKEISEELFKRIKVKTPTINDMIFAAGKYNDKQFKSKTPYYMYQKNRHCFTDFVWSKIGCWQSHVLAAREAEKRDVPTIILEEDVDIDVNFHNYVRQALKDLPKNWDILRIGSCVEPKVMKHVNGGVYMSESQICNHGYILNGASGARNFLDIIDTKDPLEAFDTVMDENKKKYTKFKSYTHKPFLATQIEYASTFKKKSLAERVDNSVGRVLTDILFLKECDDCPNYSSLNYGYIISL